MCLSVINGACITARSDLLCVGDLLNACSADRMMTHLVKKPLYSRTAASG